MCYRIMLSGCETVCERDAVTVWDRNMLLSRCETVCGRDAGTVWDRNMLLSGCETVCERDAGTVWEADETDAEGTGRLHESHIKCSATQFTVFVIIRWWTPSTSRQRRCYYTAGAEIWQAATTYSMLQWQVTSAKRVYCSSLVGQELLSAVGEWPSAADSWQDFSETSVSIM